MRDLNELNINEGGHPVTRRKPEGTDFEYLQRIIGTSLPKTYIDFMMFSNGGHPELDTFEVTIEGVKQDWAINRFFHLLTDEESTENVMYNYSHYSKVISEMILPIANDGGGNLICIDLKYTNKGRILLWIHDSPKQKLISIANSFEEFVGMLHINPDYF